MEAQHTPGPWVVTYNSGGYPAQIMAPNGDTGPGGITSVTRWNAISLPSSIQGFANARLIAAAPDLLEALENLENDNGAIPQHAWALAQAAIAKATGGAP
jgi:hypothetical protein